ncbi:MAG: hypothetical protein RMJ84_00140 [Sandaracinaceae bacterium]|nr:hypothetical protein [Sandaracinaceae bacterium]
MSLPLAASEELISELRGELEGSGDERLRRAVLLDAIGRLLNRGLGRHAPPPKELLASFNIDPSFRVPLYALIDHFEGKRSYRNLSRLYEAEANSAPSPSEKADALADLAFIAWLNQSAEEARAALGQGIDATSRLASTWALFEWVARVLGEEEALQKALLGRARTSRDPGLRWHLLSEAIRRKEEQKQDLLPILKEALEIEPKSAPLWAIFDQKARERGNWAEVVEALEGFAASSEDPLFASALLVEASALCRVRLGDAQRALKNARRGADLAPGDPFVMVELINASAEANDQELLFHASKHFLELHGKALGRLAARFHLLAGRAAQGIGRATDAIHHFEQARAIAPLAPMVLAASVSSDEEALRLRIQSLESIATDTNRPWEERIEALKEGIAVASALGDGSAVQSKIERLLALLKEMPQPKLKEDFWLDLVLLANAAQQETTLCKVLSAWAEWQLARPSDEKSLCAILLFGLRYWRTGNLNELTAISRKLLDGAKAPWLPDLVRWLALRAGDDELLGLAHEKIAEFVESKEAALFHLAAAARAHFRSGNTTKGAQALEKAQGIDPTHPYLRSLAEVLARGEPSRLVVDGEASQLSESELSKRAHLAELKGERSLLDLLWESAGSKGMSAPDLCHLGARKAIREGRLQEADRLRSEVGPIWKLLSLVRSSDRREGSERVLDSMLDDPSVGLEAGLAILAHPKAGLPQRQRVQKKIGVALEFGEDPLASLRKGEIRGWLGLADQFMNADGIGTMADGLLAHALRLGSMLGEIDDEAFIRISDLENMDEDTFPSPSLVAPEIMLASFLRGESEGIDEFLSAQERSTQKLKNPEEQLAHLRWMVQGGRGKEAIDELLSSIESHPEDLSLLDALRVAAREAKQWNVALQAIEKMIPLVSRKHQSMLWEEAGIIWMDELGDDREAIHCFERALEANPKSEIAYARLHDILVDRGEDQALVELLSERMKHFDEPEVLAPLLYEQARLFRGGGQFEEALGALEHLLLLDPEHVGGLALQAEIHVQRESFAEAVESLRALARTQGAPLSQRRLARLGAAEFLERRLGNAEAALEELEAIDAELRSADAAIIERIASLANRVGRVEEAGRALIDAARRFGSESFLRSFIAFAQKEGWNEEASIASMELEQAKASDLSSKEAWQKLTQRLAELRDGEFPLTLEHLARIERIALLLRKNELAQATREVRWFLKGMKVVPPIIQTEKLRPIAEIDRKLKEDFHLVERPCPLPEAEKKALALLKQQLGPLESVANAKELPLFEGISKQWGQNVEIKHSSKAQALAILTEGKGWTYVLPSFPLPPQRLAFEAAFCAHAGMHASPALASMALAVGADALIREMASQSLDPSFQKELLSSFAMWAETAALFSGALDLALRFFEKENADSFLRRWMADGTLKLRWECGWILEYSH